MLLFVDGFSHYTDAFLGLKWDNRNTLNVVQSLTSGRFGAGGVTFSTVNNGQGGTAQHLQKNYNGSSTIILGVALEQTQIQHQDGGWLVHFMDGSTVQLGIKIEQSGQLRLWHGTNVGGGIDPGSGWAASVTTLGMSTNSISSAGFDFLEIKVIHGTGTSGSVEIRRNGNPFYTLANINTAKSGAANSSSIIFGGHESPQASGGIFRRASFIISDVHLVNTVANPDDPLDPVDFIGDRRWEPLPPTQDGADTAWSTTGSADHFANVDEVPPNESDFNSTATVGARDGFVVQSPTGPSAASALVAVTMFCKKDTGGSNAIKCFARSGGGSYRNGTEFQVPSPYAFRQSFLCSKPGGGAITVADVASHQWGYEKTI